MPTYIITTTHSLDDRKQWGSDIKYKGLYNTQRM